MEENTQPTQPNEPEKKEGESQQPQESAPMQEQNEQRQENAQPEEGAAADSKDVEDNKAITYLSYLGLLFLVPMLAKRESKFAQFHSKQGLVLTIAWFIGSFLYPLFGLGLLVHIAIIVLSIMGLVNVHKGEMKDLPVVGDLAKKFNF